MTTKLKLIGGSGSAEYPSFSDLVADLKARLPMPELLSRLGKPHLARTSAQCPFHADASNSFSVFKGRRGWRFNCFVGCASGDELDLLQAWFDKSSEECLEIYAELAASTPVIPPPTQVTYGNKSVPAQTSNFDWAACVRGCTAAELEQFAEWRGYRPKFVRWLWDQQLISRFRNSWAFPVYDHSGVVVSCHFQTQDGWRFYPAGSRVTPLVIGDLGAKFAYVFESQFDAFAFIDRRGLCSHEVVVITRGSANGKLIRNLLQPSATLFAFPQNDEPKNGVVAAEQWLEAVARNAGCLARVARIPQQIKDMNDWTRAGATAGDLMEVLINARPYSSTPIRGNKLPQ